ncbi:hypothetical protein IKJ53_06665 [bacterium]|nr:hypothetical protein [bacterium]
MKNNISFGNRKIPKYIYHFTNNKNYKSMQKDGFIRINDNDKYLDCGGIFAVELQNFFKNWGFNKVWDNGNLDESLRTSLLRQTTTWVKSREKTRNELIILKIPTDKLDKSKLKIRSKQKFFEIFYSEKLFNKANDSLKGHLRGHTSAEDAKLYKNKKDAIEYIYQKDIPLNIVEEIGKPVNIYELRCKSNYNQENVTKLALKEALKNTPESKGLFLI